MPKVPIYDTPQVQANTLPQAYVQAGSVQDTAGRQAQQMGRAMQQSGREMAGLALEMQQQANQVRFDASATRAREIAAEMRYGKEGYENLRGADALFRQDNQYLPDEYGSRLKKEFDAISASLGNDAQKAAFARYSSEIITQFRTGAMVHVNREFQTYHLSNAKASIAQRTEDIARNYQSLGAIDNAINGTSMVVDGQTIYTEKGLRQSAFEAAKLAGFGEKEADNVARKAVSNGIKTAALAALDDNSPDHARALLNRYKNDMETDDVLSVSGKISAEMDVRLGSKVAGEAMTGAQPAIEATNVDKAFNIVVGAESGGRQFDDSGKPLISSAGAVGIAQVMPETGPEAAKLAGLAWDKNRFENDAAYNEALGKAYFVQKLRDNGGDLPKAMAAYNAGQRWVNEAVARADKAAPGTQESSWFWQLNNDKRSPENREQTKAYVEKNMAKYEAGGGKPPRPTLEELDAKLQADPRLAGNERAMKTARAELRLRFNEQTAAIAQRESEAVKAAIEQLVANGGNFAALPASVRNAIPPDKYTYVQGEAEKIGKKPKIENDAQMWAEIMTLPKEELAKFTPTTFYNKFRSVLDDAHMEKGYALVEAAKGAISDPKRLEIFTIAERVKAGARTLELLPVDGGKPTKEQAEGFALFQQKVEQRLRVMENETGRKASPDDLQKIINEISNDTVSLYRGAWFDKTKVPTYAIGDDNKMNAYVSVNGERVYVKTIPDAVRGVIVSEMQKAGRPVSERAIAETWVKQGKPR